MDAVDKDILRELQGDLPIVARPFAEIAVRLGITEEELLGRIKGLIRQGVIRKFGLRIDSERVGYASTLVALKVPWDKLEEVAEKLNSYSNVTHNYAREHEYNLWFTVIARDEEELRRTLDRIRSEVEYEDMLNLPKLRRFKINVKFDIR